MKKIQFRVSQLLVAMTLLVLLFMLALSIVGLHNVGTLKESIDFVANTGQAVRRQMDADMMHDTIRSDVLGVVLASRDGQVQKMKELESELNEHMARFDRNLAENAKAGLGESAGRQIKTITPVVNDYTKQAQLIVTSAIQSGHVDDEAMAVFVQHFATLEVEMEKLADLIQEEAELAKLSAVKLASTGQTNTLIIMVISLSGFSGLAWYVFRRIAHPLAALARVSQDINRTGNFGLRADIICDDEVGQVAGAFNGMMDSLQSVLTDINAVMGAVSKGDFSRQVKVEARGDLNLLKENVNASVNELRITMVHLNDLIKAMFEGEFNKRVEAKVEGEFKIAIDNALKAMNTMQTMLGEIGQVMSGVAQGDITQRVKAEGRGGFSELKDHLNQSLDALSCLNDILYLANALASGDLTQTIRRNYPGTFGVVIDGMNTTGQNLKGLVSEIRAATDAIHTAAKEIASGNNDLSHRTEEQAASLEETATSMNELTSTVKQNTESSKRANQLAIGAADVASKGVKVVNEVVITMDSINESSRKITEIITVIDGIAFQTNILALNAAVEAARAGEQGRGFAVVAGEVRNLAQRAAAAAGEIKDLIGNSEAKVVAGSQLVVQAGQTMEEIVNSIQAVTGIMSEISSASIEQNAGIAQVNQAIGQMDDVTQQNAALVEQAAASAESLEEQAQNLSINVAKFKIDESDYSSAPISRTTIRGSAEKSTQSGSGITPISHKSMQAATGDDWEEF